MEKNRVMVNKAELQRDKPCTQPQAVVFETQTGKSSTAAVGGVEGRKEAGILGV